MATISVMIATLFVALTLLGAAVLKVWDALIPDPEWAQIEISPQDAPRWQETFEKMKPLYGSKTTIRVAIANQRPMIVFLSASQREELEKLQKSNKDEASLLEEEAKSLIRAIKAGASLEQAVEQTGFKTQDAKKTVMDWVVEKTRAAKRVDFGFFEIVGSWRCLWSNDPRIQAIAEARGFNAPLVGLFTLLLGLLARLSWQLAIDGWKGSASLRGRVKDEVDALRGELESGIQAKELAKVAKSGSKHGRSKRL